MMTSIHETTKPVSESGGRGVVQGVARQGTGGTIHRSITDHPVCLLTFDRPESSANIFDRSTLVELDLHLSFIEKEKSLAGVVLMSAKESVFIAGADIHALAEASDAGPERLPELAELIQIGQDVFNRLASLRIPTVAAIHGACLGGGYELSLAADYRIATPDKSTRIGLPEVNLGILPAWGGSTRLPRLIGLPNALQIILGGKVVPAKKALKLGMIDELAPRESLFQSALRKIESTKEPRPNHVWVNNPVVSAAVLKRARSEVMKKTRGHYPAPLKALEVAGRGLRLSETESLQLEREAVSQLVRTDPCRNLIRIYFMQEKARKRRRGVAARKIRRAAVIGAGVMGAGIAQWLSAKGIEVMLRDVDASALNRGMNVAAKLYREGIRRRVFTPVEARAGIDRIHPVVGDSPLKRAEIVIEAAVERMDLKKELFRDLDRQANADCILATNTSALSLTELANETAQPERVVGIHFFNPVHRMQLVEVIRDAGTNEAVVEQAVQFVQQIGKLPVVVKDSPGFLVNRILMPYLVEAGSLFEQGASIEDLDASMLDFGMPMGPMRLIDEVGVDVCLHVAETLSQKFRDRLTVPDILGRMVRENRLGKKNGRGFYSYSGRKIIPDRETDFFARNNRAANLNREELQKRMVFMMINEAARCLDEAVTAGPEEIDFGMIMGTGFAPFRGGPLRYADSIGIRQLATEMRERAQQGEGQFTPCELLLRMANANERFYPEKKED